MRERGRRLRERGRWRQRLLARGHPRSHRQQLCRLRVKMRNTRNEYNESACPPTADIRGDIAFNFGIVPIAYSCEVARGKVIVSLAYRNPISSSRSSIVEHGCGHEISNEQD